MKIKNVCGCCGYPNEWYRLPGSVCDLCLLRPAVVDVRPKYWKDYSEKTKMEMGGMMKEEKEKHLVPGQKYHVWVGNELHRSLEFKERIDPKDGSRSYLIFHYKDQAIESSMNIYVNCINRISQGSYSPESTNKTLDPLDPLDLKSFVKVLKEGQWVSIGEVEEEKEDIDLRRDALSNAIETSESLLKDRHPYARDTTYIVERAQSFYEFLKGDKKERE